MGLNLHQFVRGAIGVVNTNLRVSIQVSTGDAVQPDFTRQPAYAPAVLALAQVQPLTWRDLQQLNGLNLTGVKKAIYLNGTVDGVVRVELKGGDLVTLPDGSVWLVVQPLEAYSLTAGWCKAALVLQNGS